VAVDLDAVEEAFLEAVADIEGIHFAHPHDPDVGLPDNLPGVTLSFIGAMPRYVELGPGSDWEAEWLVRLYLPYRSRSQARDDLIAYVPAIGEVVRALPGVVDPGPNLNIGEEPEYDAREGSRKVVKRMTLSATVYDAGT
jgi:hypothetical protein